MRVFLLRFVRVGDPTANLTDMYDTSPGSQAHGAVYRLLFISIAFIFSEYKAKCNLASRSYVVKRNRDFIDYNNRILVLIKMFNTFLFGPFVVYN